MLESFQVFLEVTLELRVLSSRDRLDANCAVDADSPYFKGLHVT